MFTPDIHDWAFMPEFTFIQENWVSKQPANILVQPCICAPGTHHSWIEQMSVEYEVC